MTPSERDLEKAAEEYAKHFAPPAIAYGADILRAFKAGARSRDAEVSSLCSELCSEVERLKKTADHWLWLGMETGAENKIIRSRLAAALWGLRYFKGVWNPYARSFITDEIFKADKEARKK